MKIVNVVLSGKFSLRLDLTSIANCVYRPERFSGGVCEHMGCTFLLFSTGSFVCLGSKSIHMGEQGVSGMAKKLEVEVLTCVCKNIVISDRVNYELQMTNVYEHIRNRTGCVTFEDELFNGIVWKEGGGTVRLFHTGSFFITGLRCEREARNLCDRVRKICIRYRK